MSFDLGDDTPAASPFAAEASRAPGPASPSRLPAPGFLVSRVRPAAAAGAATSDVAASGDDGTLPDLVVPAPGRPTGARAPGHAAAGGRKPRVVAPKPSATAVPPAPARAGPPSPEQVQADTLHRYESAKELVARMRREAREREARKRQIVERENVLVTSDLAMLEAARRAKEHQVEAEKRAARERRAKEAELRHAEVQARLEALRLGKARGSAVRGLGVGGAVRADDDEDNAWTEEPPLDGAWSHVPVQSHANWSGAAPVGQHRYAAALRSSAEESVAHARAAGRGAAQAWKAARHGGDDDMPIPVPASARIASDARAAVAEGSHHADAHGVRQFTAEQQHRSSRADVAIPSPARSEGALPITTSATKGPAFGVVAAPPERDRKRAGRGAGHVGELRELARARDGRPHEQRVIGGLGIEGNASDMVDRTTVLPRPLQLHAWQQPQALRSLRDRQRQLADAQARLAAMQAETERMLAEEAALQEQMRRAAKVGATGTSSPRVGGVQPPAQQRAAVRAVPTPVLQPPPESISPRDEAAGNFGSWGTGDAHSARSGVSGVGGASQRFGDDVVDESSPRSGREPAQEARLAQADSTARSLAAEMEAASADEPATVAPTLTSPAREPALSDAPGDASRRLISARSNESTSSSPRRTTVSHHIGFSSARNTSPGRGQPPAVPSAEVQTASARAYHVPVPSQSSAAVVTARSETARSSHAASKPDVRGVEAPSDDVPHGASLDDVPPLDAAGLEFLLQGRAMAIKHEPADASKPADGTSGTARSPTEAAVVAASAPSASSGQDEAEAAARIQALARGHLTRKQGSHQQLSAPSEEAPPSTTSARVDSNAGAAVVAAAAPETHSSSSKLDEDIAATRIQAAARGRSVRKGLAVTEPEPNEASLAGNASTMPREAPVEAADEAAAAATRIQAVARGRAVRKGRGSTSAETAAGGAAKATRVPTSAPGDMPLPATAARLDEETAATRIQAAARGRAVRKGREPAQPGEPAASHNTGPAVASSARSPRKDARTAPDEELAATRIQAVARGRSVRKTRGDGKQNLPADAPSDVQTATAATHISKLDDGAAATRIQAIARGRAVRKGQDAKSTSVGPLAPAPSPPAATVIDADSAAIRIQAVARGRAVRKGREPAGATPADTGDAAPIAPATARVPSEPPAAAAAANMDEEAAATRIQAIARGRAVRKGARAPGTAVAATAEPDSTAVVRIQAVYRGHRVRKHRGGAVAVGATLPADTLPRRVPPSEDVAAQRIQAVARGHLVRKRLSNAQGPQLSDTVMGGPLEQSLVAEDGTALVDSLAAPADMNATDVLQDSLEQ